jgi:hypothetical protein
MLFKQFSMAEEACRKYLEAGWQKETQAPAARKQHPMALPAYDQCIKASHVFNLLDARGVISVTERQSWRSCACAQSWQKPAAKPACIPKRRGGGDRVRAFLSSGFQFGKPLPLAGEGRVGSEMTSNMIESHPDG